MAKALPLKGVSSQILQNHYRRNRIDIPNVYDVDEGVWYT
tara:strand:+ start:15085 stop:15204 length:120 start_codon:yes stop_codon:yes gene_type:complete